MAPGRRSSWPLVLLLGIALALAVAVAAAVAAPSHGRPWWHEGGRLRLTATVASVEPEAQTVRLDEVTTYDPVRHGTVGTVDVTVLPPVTVEPDGRAWTDLRVGDTVDVEIHRRDGGWRADAITLLDPN